MMKGGRRWWGNLLVLSTTILVILTIGATESPTSSVPTENSASSNGSPANQSTSTFIAQNESLISPTSASIPEILQLETAGQPKIDASQDLIKLLNDIVENRIYWDKVNEILDLVTANELLRFFEQNSEIDLDLLHDLGLGPESVYDFYRVLTRAPDQVRLIESNVAKGVSYKALAEYSSPHYTNALFDLDKSVFVHMNLPDRFQESTLFARWISLDNPDFLHFDAYPVQGTPQETQELWLRQSDGWDAGRYRLEIYSPRQLEAQDSPISHFEFTVYEYGAE